MGVKLEADVVKETKKRLFYKESGNLIGNISIVEYKIDGFSGNLRTLKYFSKENELLEERCWPYPSFDHSSIFNPAKPKSRVDPMDFDNVYGEGTYEKYLKGKIKMVEEK